MNISQSSRFKDAPWYDPNGVDVIIGGSGGIGSWLALLLSRAGFIPIIYDFDEIEEHNLGGQLFSKSHIGMKKVDAIAQVVKQFADTDIVTMNEKYTSESMSHHYVFSAFDNMQARKDMFGAWKDYVEGWKLGISADDDAVDRSVPIFIDGRLTAEQLQIFCVTPSRIEDYEKHLFDDSEVEDAPCTMKQTSHAASMIASLMTGFFTNHFANNKVGEIDRNVPFFKEFFIPINYTNEED